MRTPVCRLRVLKEMVQGLAEAGKKLPEYKDVVECEGRATDIKKLRYYNTNNINKVGGGKTYQHSLPSCHLSCMLSPSSYECIHTCMRQHYDASLKLHCDKWKIAKRVESPTSDGPEMEYTCDLNRVLYLDESACRDKKEQARLAKAFLNRLTRKRKRKKGRRRFAQVLTVSVHETVVTGFNLVGDAVPPVWVLNVERIAPQVSPSPLSTLPPSPPSTLSQSTLPPSPPSTLSLSTNITPFSTISQVHHSPHLDSQINV